MGDTNPQEKEGGNQNSQVSTGSSPSLSLPSALHHREKTARGAAPGKAFSAFQGPSAHISVPDLTGSYPISPHTLSPLVVQGDDLMAIKAKRMAERKAAEAAEAASGSGNPASAPAEQK